MRGVDADGSRTHLISLATWQWDYHSVVAITQKRNEITAAHILFNGERLMWTLITMDVLLAQRTLACQILGQGDHYLMVIKQNREQMRDEVAPFFDLPDHPTDGDSGMAR